VKLGTVRIPSNSGAFRSAEIFIRRHRQMMQAVSANFDFLGALDAQLVCLGAMTRLGSETVVAL
jgi:hypothetical protein